MALRESGAVTILGLLFSPTNRTRLGILLNKARILYGFAGLLAASALVAPLTQAEPAPQPAPAPGPLELREMKADLRAGILAAAIPEVKAHREDLLALEKKLAVAEDFAGALRTRTERTKVESKIVSLEHEAAILASRPTR